VVASTLEPAQCCRGGPHESYNGRLGSVRRVDPVEQRSRDAHVSSAFNALMMETLECFASFRPVRLTRRFQLAG
jgi:hypothetical protein